MKVKTCAVLAICVLSVVVGWLIAGCTATQQAKVSSVVIAAEKDACSLAGYYTEYLAGVAQTAGTIAGVGPLVAEGNQIVAGLYALCGNGVKTGDTVTSAAEKVFEIVQVINGVVGASK